MQFLKKDSVEFDMTFIFKGKSFKLLATLKIRTYHGFGTQIKAMVRYSVFTKKMFLELLCCNGKKNPNCILEALYSGWFMHVEFLSVSF
jgi:hypothetical protein